jgi:hypothetical protein
MAKGAALLGVRSTLVALGIAVLAIVGTTSCVVQYDSGCPCDVDYSCTLGCSCDPDCQAVVTGGYQDTPCASESNSFCGALACLVDDTQNDSWCGGTCINDGDCTPDGCCLSADPNDPTATYCYPPRYCGAGTDGGPGTDAISTDGGPGDDLDAGTADAAVDAGDAAPADATTADAPSADAPAADGGVDGGSADGGADAAAGDAGPDGGVG